MAEFGFATRPAEPAGASKDRLSPARGAKRFDAPTPVNAVREAEAIRKFEQEMRAQATKASAPVQLSGDPFADLRQETQTLQTSDYMPKPQEVVAPGSGLLGHAVGLVLAETRTQEASVSAQNPAPSKLGGAIQVYQQTKMFVQETILENRQLAKAS